MSVNTTIGWIWLLLVMGIANPRTAKLVRQYADITELHYAMHEPDNHFLKEKEYQKVNSTSLGAAKQIVTSCQQNHIGIITWDSPQYPKQLRHIYNAPIVLFYRGNPELLQTDSILTVVGTRHPSDYSIRTGERLCFSLAQQNLLLASGGAMGMDSVAHHAALMAGKPTIAVMGCGLDCDYPKDNRLLREKIRETGVCISEYFPGTPAYGRNFPVRNRILSGISKGVLVLEAAEKSGAMITANSACEQNRAVFCIPPADIFDRRYDGQAALLRDGATPVFSAEDVLPIKESMLFEPVCQTEPEESPEITDITDITDIADVIELPEIPETQETQETQKNSEISEIPEIPELPEISETDEPDRETQETESGETVAEIQMNHSTGSPLELPVSFPILAHPDMPVAAEQIPDADEMLLAAVAQAKAISKTQLLPMDATPEQKKILELLRQGDKNTDMLCLLSQMRFELLSVNLVEMEIQGWISNDGMDNFQLTDDLK